MRLVERGGGHARVPASITLLLDPGRRDHSLGQEIHEVASPAKLAHGRSVGEGTGSRMSNRVTARAIDLGDAFARELGSVAGLRDSRLSEYRRN